jgi:hypothetical protein
VADAADAARATHLGASVGRILGGPLGPFTHDQAHLPDLRAFVQLHGA